MIKRDKWGQQVGEWTDADYRILSILEEISMDPDRTTTPDKTLAAYLADIKDIIASVPEAMPVRRQRMTQRSGL
jgi:hypothetical protein